MSTTHATRTVYSPEERITHALGRMPYLPMSSFYSQSSDPETLCRTLEAFADALAALAERHELEHQELTQLRADRAALRRLIGTEA